jgi:hypothetical protein
MRNLPDASLCAPDEVPIAYKTTETPSITSCVIAFVTLPVTVTVCASRAQAQSRQTATFTPEA